MSYQNKTEGIVNSAHHRAMGKPELLANCFAEEEITEELNGNKRPSMLCVMAPRA